jgi:hypothetical protein
MPVTEIIRNISGNSGFHVRKDFSEDYPQFGQVPSKIFASPVLGRKYLRSISFKGHQVFDVPGTPTCLRPALIGVLVFVISEG